MHVYIDIIRSNISYSLLFPFFLLSPISLNCPLYQEYSSVITRGHSSRDEQSLATLQGRIQPNYLLLDRDTLHPHIGTLSTKTNLFPHSQDYCLLSPAQSSTWDGPNLSEHDRILSPKQSLNTSFGSFMHVKCQLSCILTFFFQKLKNYEKNL